MAAELIQSVQFSNAETISVVAGYTLSLVSQLVPDSLPRIISFTYAESPPQVAVYNGLPLQFQPDTNANLEFTVTLDPDLDSSLSEPVD